MAARRWLSIVVDGSTAMAPYWRKIVSDYLVNIVRSFFANSRREGGYPTCEVGLIMYNPNPSLGRNVHYINWTNNMDQFLALLPFLSFKGHSLNHTAAEGLAEALGMFPRDRMTEREYFECERHCILVATGEPVAERMLVPLPRVHDGKFIHGQIRILLANFLDVAKMFVPLKISLSVITPTLHPLFVSIFNEGNSLDKSTPIMDYGNGQITVLLSNNFKEAKNVHYSKGIESVKTTTSIPINFSNSYQGDRYSASSMNIGQLSIQGFQNVRRESASKLPLVAPQVTSEMHAPSTGCFVPMDSYAELMSLLNDDNNDYQQDQPRKKSKTSVPTFEEEDSLAYLFQLDQPVSLDEILGEGQTLFSQTQVGGESSQVLRDIVPQSVTRGSVSTIQFTSNSSERMNISISPGIVACTSSGSSNGLAHELGGNMGVVNPMFSSDLNCLNSSLSLPQNNPKFWPAGSNTLFPPQTAASFGDSTFFNTIENSNIQFEESSSFQMLQFGSASAGLGSAGSASSDFGNSLTQFQYPNTSVNPYDCANSIVGDHAGGSTLDGNSFSQFQPPSFPVHRYGSLTASVACASASTDAIVVASASASAANGSASSYGSRQQFKKRNHLEMRGIDPLGVPSAMVPNPLASPVPIMPQYNQTQLLPRQPFLPDFKDFIPAWEGYLVGSIHPYCAFFNQAKAWRKKTSPVTITYQWSTTLEIVLYLPKKAVMHTMRTYGGILDDVLFEVTQFDNLDLYHHLTTNNLCAKIALPSHTLTLSTTENKHCYTGSIFPGDAVFVEPL